MEYMQKLSEKVLTRMAEVGYKQKFINSLKEFQSEAQVMCGVSLMNLRDTLEEFMKETTDLAPKYKGVQFLGDKARPVEVRDFVKNMKWIKEGREFEFISTFYGFLSFVAAHHGDSYIDLTVATYTNWYIFDLVSSRIGLSESRGSLPPTIDSAHHYNLVNQFLWSIRKERYKGRAFEVHFDADIMKLARTMLRKTDAPFLLKLLSDSTVSQDLQNRAASLLLSDKITADPALKVEITQQMSRYYLENFNPSNWKAFRGIALALSNRVNYDECILHYIKWIEEDSARIEDNLKETDNYHKGTSRAIEWYLRRVNHDKIPSAGCVWEIFYLGRRAQSKDAQTISVLKRRLKRTEKPEIHRICTDAIKLLSQ